MWSEATRNPSLIALADEIFEGLRGLITDMLQRWQESGGRLPMPAGQLTPVLLSLVQGFVVQQALAGQPMIEDYSAAVTTLFTAAGLGPRP